MTLPSDDAARRHARDLLEQVMELLSAVFPYQGAAFRSYRVALLALFEHATICIDFEDLVRTLDALEDAAAEARVAFRAYETAIHKSARDPAETKPDAIAAAMVRHGWEKNE